MDNVMGDGVDDSQGKYLISRVTHAAALLALRKERVKLTRLELARFIHER